MHILCVEIVSDSADASHRQTKCLIFVTSSYIEIVVLCVSVLFLLQMPAPGKLTWKLWRSARGLCLQSRRWRRRGGATRWSRSARATARSTRSAPAAARSTTARSGSARTAWARIRRRSRSTPQRSAPRHERALRAMNGWERQMLHSMSTMVFTQLCVFTNGFWCLCTAHLAILRRLI